MDADFGFLGINFGRFFHSGSRAAPSSSTEQPRPVTDASPTVRTLTGARTLSAWSGPGGSAGARAARLSEITSFQLTVSKQEYGSTVAQFFKTSQTFNFGVCFYL